MNLQCKYKNTPVNELEERIRTIESEITLRLHIRQSISQKMI